MSKILVFTEIQNGNIKRSSLELVSAATQFGKPFSVVCMGTQSESASQILLKSGAGTVHLFKEGQYDQYNPEIFSASLVGLIEKGGYTHVLATASSLGKDLFPKIAAKLSGGIISDCTEVTLEGESFVVKKPMYSGKALAKMTFEDSKVQIVLMRANQLPVKDLSSGSAATISAEAATGNALKTLVKEIVKGTTEKLDLTEANIIVGGGRGLKDAENFKILNPLADALGATVGASRAVVDAGWCSHSMQVGQTGKTVAPSLYIAVGISGAIQHLAGMTGSKVIVAINSDANAPIFQKATYGIVGDAFEIVPKLTEEFKKALHK